MTWGWWKASSAKPFGKTLHVTRLHRPRFAEYLDKMLKEPFEPFTFSPVGAAVYHLGHYGTAAKELKEFDLKP